MDLAVKIQTSIAIKSSQIKTSRINRWASLKVKILLRINKVRTNILIILIIYRLWSIVSKLITE